MIKGHYFYPCVYETIPDKLTRRKSKCYRMEFSKDGIARHLLIHHGREYTKEYGYTISERPPIPNPAEIISDREFGFLDL